MSSTLQAKCKIKVGPEIVERRVYIGRVGTTRFFYIRWQGMLYLAEPNGDTYKATRKLTPAEAKAINPYIQT